MRIFCQVTRTSRSKPMKETVARQKQESWIFIVVISVQFSRSVVPDFAIP